MPQPKRTLVAFVFALASLLAGLLAGCAAEATHQPLPVPTPSGQVRTYPLPTPGFAVASPAVCAGIGLASSDGKGLVLRGDPADAALTWLTNPDGSGRWNVVWSPGLRARFDPGLEVLDQSGAEIAREGMRITTACGTQANGSLWVVPSLQ